MKPLRILFADDQLPSPIDAENERTRNELRRELANRPEIEDINKAFDEDFQWFNGLLDYLEKTKHVRVIRAASFGEACSRLENPQEFDVAVIDLSWWGDATLPPGRQHRHNRGLELLERIAACRRASGKPIPTIALSQNFRDNFELMSTVLEMDALPIPKAYDRLGYRALFAALQHLARLSLLEIPEQGHTGVRLFISHAHRDSDVAMRLVGAFDLAMEVPAGAIRCTSVPGYKLDLGSMAPDALRRELATAEAVVGILTPVSLASQWVLFELGATWLQAKHAILLLGGGLRDEDVPGPLRGIVAGRLDDTTTLYQLLDQLKRALGWPERNMVAAHSKLAELATHVASRPLVDPIPEDPIWDLLLNISHLPMYVADKNFTIVKANNGLANLLFTDSTTLVNSSVNDLVNLLTDRVHRSYSEKYKLDQAKLLERSKDMGRAPTSQQLTTVVDNRQVESGLYSKGVFRLHISANILRSEPGGPPGGAFVVMFPARLGAEETALLDKKGRRRLPSEER
jgi:hypothetical protein